MKLYVRNGEMKDLTSRKFVKCINDCYSLHTLYNKSPFKETYNTVKSKCKTNVFENRSSRLILVD